MKLFTIFALLLIGSSFEARAQTQQYKDMSRADRLAFVDTQARRIARAISGNEYEFSKDFDEEIRKSLTQYADRIGAEKSDLVPVLQRAQTNASVVMTIFKQRNVSPLIGLYIPWVESEYKNIEPADSKAAVGVFQMLPTTGLKFGLTPQEL